MRAINAVRELNEELDEPITRDRALHGARAPRAVRPPGRRAPLPRPRDDRGRGRQVHVAPTSTTSASSARWSRREADVAWVGWGFVAEHPAFAELCEKLGITFVGPDADVMRALGDKIEGKKLAEQAGVPVAPWSGGPVETAEEARKVGEELGFPLMIKAAAGGGGRGMRRVDKAEELEQAIERARAEAESAFGDPSVLMERLVGAARHVEVQLMADGAGRRVGARRARLQLPAPPPEGRRGVRQPGARRPSRSRARRVRRSGSRSRPATRAPAPSSSSTSPTAASSSFMEVNTRLQVEHPVTEAVTGADLVRLQLHVAAGGTLEGDPPPPRGHAIEVRLNAEDPGRGFAPVARPHHASAPARRPRHPRRLRRRRGRHRPGRVRLDDGQDHRPRRHARAGDRAPAPGGRRHDGRRSRRGPPTRASCSSCSAARSCATARSTPAGSTACRPRARCSRCRHADAALVQAAIALYDAATADERARFYALARRGRPSADADVCRTVDLLHRGVSYRFQVCQIAPRRYLVEVDGTRIEASVEPLTEHESRLTYGGHAYRTVTALQDADLLVEINGVPHRVSRDEGGLIRSHGPGVVVAIPVSEGDEVQAGDVVAVTESDEDGELADRDRPRARARGARLRQLARPGRQATAADRPAGRGGGRRRGRAHPLRARGRRRARPR